jgi:hypothetical protein
LVDVAAAVMTGREEHVFVTGGAWTLEGARYVGTLGVAATIVTSVLAITFVVVFACFTITVIAGSTGAFESAIGVGTDSAEVGAVVNPSAAFIYVGTGHTVFVRLVEYFFVSVHAGTLKGGGMGSLVVVVSTMSIVKASVGAVVTFINVNASNAVADKVVWTFATKTESVGEKAKRVDAVSLGVAVVGFSGAFVDVGTGLPITLETVDTGALIGTKYICTSWLAATSAFVITGVIIRAFVDVTAWETVAAKSGETLTFVWTVSFNAVSMSVAFLIFITWSGKTAEQITHWGTEPRIAREGEAVFTHLVTFEKVHARESVAGVSVVAVATEWTNSVGTGPVDTAGKIETFVNINTIKAIALVTSIALAFIRSRSVYTRSVPIAHAIVVASVAFIVILTVWSMAAARRVSFGVADFAVAVEHVSGGYLVKILAETVFTVAGVAAEVVVRGAFI